MARILAAVAMLALAACGGDKEGDTETPAKQNEAADNGNKAGDSKAGDPVKPAKPDKPEPVERRTLLTVGTPAPDFTIEAHDGKTISMAKLAGKAVVLYFYPKDETPG